MFQRPWQLILNLSPVLWTSKRNTSCVSHVNTLLLKNLVITSPGSEDFPGECQDAPTDWFCLEKGQRPGKSLGGISHTAKSTPRVTFNLRDLHDISRHRKIESTPLPHKPNSLCHGNTVSCCDQTPPHVPKNWTTIHICSWSTASCEALRIQKVLVFFFTYRSFSAPKVKVYWLWLLERYIKYKFTFALRVFETFLH